MTSFLRLALEYGNYNRLIQKLEEQDFDIKSTIEGSLAEMFSEKPPKELWLPLEACKKFSLKTIECQQNIIIPAYHKQGQFGILLIPYLNFSIQETNTKKGFFNESFANAYDCLQSILWELAPLSYINERQLWLTLKLPGGSEFHQDSQAVPATDGDSAGIGFLMTMLQGLTNLQIAQTTAFTGSLKPKDNRIHNLDMPVEYIKNLKEKIDCILLERPDITRIIIPKANEKDLSKLGLNKPQHNKIYLVETVRDLLEICFGKDWKERGQITSKEIMQQSKDNGRHFYEKARDTQSKKATRARSMYLHLADYLERCKAEEIHAQNLLCKTWHRIAGTYKDEPLVQRDFLKKSLQKTQELDREGFAEHREYGKLLTSYARLLVNLYEYEEAHQQNNKALEIISEKLAQMPNIAIKGQIHLAQQQYQEAERSLLEALQLADRLADLESAERYSCYLLKVYVLSKNWEKALEMATTIQHRAFDSSYSQMIIWEWMGWCRVYNIEIPEHFPAPKISSKKPEPHRLFIQGLWEIHTPKEAADYFGRGEQKILDKAKANNLWSIVPFVWQHYSHTVSLQQCQMPTEIIQQLQEKAKQCTNENFRLSLQSHIEDHGKITTCDQLRDWCQKFRCFFPS